MNNVTITGNLGRDPELRYTTNGTAICDLSIAVKDFATSNGEKIEKTYWFNARIIGKLAESANAHLAKGRKVGVSGKLTQDTWEKDGQKHSIVRILAREVEFLSPKQNGVHDHIEVSEDDPF